MYQLGDRIVYSSHGVCTVIGVEERKIDRKVTQYYVLEPMDQPGARYYVPTQNQAALAKIRNLLSADELNEILRSDKVRQDGWIPDENRRKQHYRELINSGDRCAILCMIRSLHIPKKQQVEAGRKFHISDESFLRDAQKLLTSEFSFVLGIPADQVGEYVLKALEEQ